MQVFCEKVGILGPVHRLAGQGLSDVEIAKKLGITELKVEGCVAWILHFLRFTEWTELLRYASPRTTTI